MMVILEKPVFVVKIAKISIEGGQTVEFRETVMTS
jgi:hypothetical protein